MNRCWRRRVWIAAAPVILGALLAPAAAVAHVEVRPSRMAPGYGMLQFFLYHGCGSAPTERFVIRIPDGVGLAQPHVKAGWDISTVTSDYAQPLEVYGEVHTKGVTEATWSGGSIPSAYLDNFVLAVFVRDVPGQTLEFPVEQWCTGRSAPEAQTLEVVVPASQPPPPPPPPDEGNGSAGASAEHDDHETAAGAASPRLSMVLSGVALVVALIALAVAARRRS